MKKNLLILLFALVACAGCAHYDIVLSNGEVITSHGKPRLDKEKVRYLFTDAKGHHTSIPASKVVEIAPQSMRKKEGTQFISR